MGECPTPDGQVGAGQGTAESNRKCSTAQFTGVHPIVRQVLRRATEETLHNRGAQGPMRNQTTSLLKEAGQQKGE